MNSLISNDNRNFVYRCEIRKFSFKLKEFLDDLRKVYENYQSGV